MIPSGSRSSTKKFQLLFEFDAPVAFYDTRTDSFVDYHMFAKDLHLPQGMLGRHVLCKTADEANSVDFADTCAKVLPTKKKTTALADACNKVIQLELVSTHKRISMGWFYYLPNELIDRIYGYLTDPSDRYGFCLGSCRVLYDSILSRRPLLIESSSYHLMVPAIPKLPKLTHVEEMCWKRCMGFVFGNDESTRLRLDLRDFGSRKQLIMNLGLLYDFLKSLRRSIYTNYMEDDSVSNNFRSSYDSSTHSEIESPKLQLWMEIVDLENVMAKLSVLDHGKDEQKLKVFELFRTFVSSIVVTHEDIKYERPLSLIQRNAIESVYKMALMIGPSIVFYLNLNLNKQQPLVARSQCDNFANQISGSGHRRRTRMQCIVTNTSAETQEEEDDCRGFHVPFDFENVIWNYSNEEMCV